MCGPAGVVDACLIPEVPFKLHGEHGLFKYLESVIKYKGHCVVCVAEGAGQVRWMGLRADGQRVRGMRGCCRCAACSAVARVRLR